MTIAYFIMVHHKPEQLEWLLNAIYTPDDLFLIHVDLKSRLGIKPERRGLMKAVDRLAAGKPNVRIMRSRFTNWGGWSLSRILLDAIGLALRLRDDWTHFVNLSGQCYPLKPLATIRRELVAAGDQVHVQLLPLDSLPADDWHLKMHPMLETPLRALKLPGRRKPPTRFSMDYKGSQWTVLPRAFCEWLARSPERRAITAYMRRILLSDELIMQALATNSPYANRIAPDYRRAIIWPGPRVLTSQDMPFLTASGAWFGRKFDATRDVEILKKLASESGFRPGPLPVA